MYKSFLSSSRIHFEITETAGVTQADSALKILTDLRDRGCAVSLDHFGSGLSSFKYLKQFPINYLKIDGSFIREIGKSSTDYAIVNSIHRLAHELGIKTIAEYVENVQLLSILKEIGADYAQGYGICMPQPLESFINLLSSRILEAD